MAYDIYGNDLRRGYCEVHPHVQQEYPCDLCYAKSQKEQPTAPQRKIYNSETVRVVVDEFIKRIPRSELNQQYLDIDFNGQYMVQIGQYVDPFSQDNNGIWEVTNAMNGDGFNCFEEFKDFKVTILND